MSSGDNDDNAEAAVPIGLMAFAGVGHGRPGAISTPGGDGSEIVAYIRAMRDEWDGNDSLAVAVEAGLEALEDSRAGRLLTIEEADARFEQDLAAARERVQAKIHGSVE